jgi:hypothetical protein
MLLMLSDYIPSTMFHNVGLGRESFVLLQSRAQTFFRSRRMVNCCLVYLLLDLSSGSRFPAVQDCTLHNGWHHWSPSSKNVDHSTVSNPPKNTLYKTDCYCTLYKQMPIKPDTLHLQVVKQSKKLYSLYSLQVAKKEKDNFEDTSVDWRIILK